MRKKTRHYPLIYARYVFPLAFNLAIIILSFIPNIRFTLDTDQRQTMSLAKLIKNTWDNSRVYLFSAQTQQTNDGALFYKTVFTLLIILILLFVIGTLVNVFSAIACKTYFMDGKTKLRNIYTSIVPNRTVMLLLVIPLLPIAFFPDILVSCYRHLLLYNVSVDYSFISSGIIALILFAALVAVTFLSRKKEEELNCNIFKYNKASAKSPDDNDNGKTDNTVRHYSFNSSDNVADSLLDLLDDNKKDSDKESES